VTCKQCGTEIAESALICYRCGRATAEPRVKPPAPAPIFEHARPTPWIPIMLAAVVVLAVVAWFVLR
jgi:hypothetical protein